MKRRLIKMKHRVNLKRTIRIVSVAIENTTSPCNFQSFNVTSQLAPKLMGHYLPKSYITMFAKAHR
jgi:hypothetical protein